MQRERFCRQQDKMCGQQHSSYTPNPLAAWRNWKKTATFTLNMCVRACACACVCVCVCACACNDLFFIILYVDCFGRTMLYMCIEYHI